MKIAFTSCANLQDFPRQPGWQRIKETEPDVLLLLGDQIYMDFGLPPKGDLGRPRKFTLSDFAHRMYARYKAQWAEPNFQSLLRDRPEMRVAATWDDHDFAWNNACGGRCLTLEPGDQATRQTVDGKNHKVPDERKWVARALFSQYLSALRMRVTEYPDPPFAFDKLPIGLSASTEGIQEAFSLDGGAIKVVMLDVRYGRDCRTYPSARIIDEAQEQWVRQQLEGHQEMTLLCSGSTLTNAECWRDYSESWDALMRQTAGKKVLVLAGDIHQNAFHRHHNSYNTSIPLYEAIASGLAIKGFKPFKWLGKQENFGLLEIEATQITIRLFRKHGRQTAQCIQRASWK